MGLISILIKIYLVILLLRGVMTRQELYFNPIGKFIASATEPIFSLIFKKFNKAQTDRLIPLLILVLILIYALFDFLFYGNFILAIIRSFTDIISFLMLFYMIAVFLGSLANTYHSNVYTTFFYRIGLFWVKFTRTFIPVSGSKIIIPTIIVIFIIFVLINTLFISIFSITTGSGLNLPLILNTSVKNGLFEIVGILRIVAWLIIIRAIVSWVSPDPSNPVVQLLVAFTDPFISPLRKVIPPLGMVDITPIIALLLLEFIRIFLIRLIGIIFG
jgi:YggT family protein